MTDRDMLDYGIEEQYEELISHLMSANTGEGLSTDEIRRWRTSNRDGLLDILHCPFLCEIKQDCKTIDIECQSPTLDDYREYIAHHCDRLIMKYVKKYGSERDIVELIEWYFSEWGRYSVKYPPEHLACKGDGK